ncbi:MAG: hypothetical protein IPG91_02380 [Ideonella sp.]|nr:hypothetical protein [Ideonella sp.]
MLASADPARLRLRLMPGVATLASDWPVASIHAAHARDADEGAFAIARMRVEQRRGECVVVARDGWRGVVRAIDAPALRFMQTFAGGSDLARAIDAAGEGLDFAAWLADALRWRWLCGVEYLPG